MNEGSKIRKIILTAMFAAVIAVLSQIAIPMPSGVPVTLQTFAVALSGSVLGWKLGAVSSFVYLLVGAVGLPVYSGFTGGAGILFGPTGGFIFGFILMAALCGAGTKLHNRAAGIIMALAGLLVCHFLGAAWYAITAGTSLWASVLVVSLPFVLKDIVSVIFAYLIAKTVVSRAARAGIEVRS